MTTSDREQFWGSILVTISVINWFFGLVILGLSVGTVQGNVFKLGVWWFLEPLWEIACADISAGAFIMVASVGSCLLLKHRTKSLVMLNVWGAGVLCFFTMAVGISTLVIATEKNLAYEQMTILVCLSTWGFSDSNHEGSPSDQLWNTVMKGANGIMTQDDIESVSRKLPFGLDIFKMKPIPKGYGDCKVFDDLMTPCGALLIIVSISYIFHVYVAHKLFRKIGKEDARRNSKYNVEPRVAENDNYA